LAVDFLSLVCFRLSTIKKPFYRFLITKRKGQVENTWPLKRRRKGESFAFVKERDRSFLVLKTTDLPEGFTNPQGISFRLLG
jgi:hypothetical protein